MSSKNGLLDPPQIDDFKNRLRTLEYKHANEGTAKHQRFTLCQNTGATPLGLYRQCSSGELLAAEKRSTGARAIESVEGSRLQ
jgi:hypothetical protein